MNVTVIPRTVLASVEPAVWSLASRLFILTSQRSGSSRFKPTVSTFYETGIVTALYETLLMSPALAHLEIRHEMPFKLTSSRGAPKRVDLWIRPVNGGYPHLFEAGDFTAGKVHRDLAKLKAINPKGANWFLAFFREGAEAMDPWSGIQHSLALPRRGLIQRNIEVREDLTKSFVVHRPGTTGEAFGVALIKAA